MAEQIDEIVSNLLQSGMLAEAVQQVLTTYGPELRGFLRGTFSDHDDGDDVFQEVSVAIWERLPEFRFQSSLRTWCYAIAHYRVIKRLKRYSRRNGRRLDTDRQAGLPAHSLTSLIEHQQRAEAATAAAAQLTPSEREVLILRAERGLAFDEIAVVLGLSSEASARQRFHRAKDRLKALLTSPSAGVEAV